jgi:hypothetical protein
VIFVTFEGNYGRLMCNGANGIIAIRKGLGISCRDSYRLKRDKEILELELW